MKLLGWVHRKFRQNNSNETQRDFSMGHTGQQTIEDFQCYQRGNNCNKPFSYNKTQRDSYRRSSFTGLETAIMEEEDYLEDDQEPSAALTELFHGFLAIGTLGSEQMANDIDPETPAFSFSMDDITEKETEVTENQLRLINDELEKVLGAEARESCTFSSGRNSHVSAGRISHCSSITLSGKPLNDTADPSPTTYGNGEVICPLQSYLLGSADMAQPVKKERRTSLGELFQKTKAIEENSGTKSEKSSMKKILKKKLLNASTKNSGTDSANAEKKLTKILQIFNRKVHPESSILGVEKHNKNEYKNMMESKSGDILWPSADDITIYPQGTIPKSFKNQSSQSNLVPQNVDTSGNEIWVKSDADYLVLEL